MNFLITISIALLAGLLLSRLARKLHLPAVTAYLVAGVMVGPYVLGKLDLNSVGFNSAEYVETFGILSNMALGFIAFEIGNEFRLSQLKMTGKRATVIGILQAVVTTLIVDAALIGLHFIIPEKLSLSTALTLGAIASATAPAATLMVVKQYKAKGPLTDLLLPIVALDDAVGLMLFAVSFGIAKALKSGSVSLLSVLVEPLLEILLSLAIGAVLGFLLTFAEKFFHSRSNRTGLIVTFIMLGVGISLIKFNIGPVHIGFSSLLLLMMLGTVFCNTCAISQDLMNRSDRWAGPLLIFFFVLSGAELQFSVFSNLTVVLIGGVYILFRSLGKYFGAFSSAKLMKCEPNITNYLGVTLLPQAGVALGMINTVKQTFGAHDSDAVIIAQVILFSVLIYELFGPLCTRIALEKAGDIAERDPEVHRDLDLSHHRKSRG